ncbi:DEAD/DEAH box helicase [Candidatus Peregrinibacteria bacterium]|nr:MAG: DEAD/DEAH box helicase [Candidatus Peregrinibacteria bacterium]
MNFKKPFVILDLETSGLDPKRSDIIEVAMIRYENGKEVARYDDLIRIDSPLPEVVTVITGITDQDLQQNGRPAQEVYSEVSRLLDGAYLVGHNIPFDHGFLKHAGVSMNLLGILDTLVLAQIFMPGSPSFSLESLSDDLEITHVNKHRAMGDVEATLELFRHLTELAAQIPATVMPSIQAVCNKGSWDGKVLFQPSPITNTITQTKSDSYSLSNRSSSNHSSTIEKGLSVEEVLGTGGVLNHHWDDYEVRSGQLKMSQAIDHAFREGYHLICEAPTGIGKSLAYLIPAFQTALDQKTKVVISTNTINLQQQLFDKDVPMLQDLYRRATGKASARVTLLKGRRHYLCLKRLDHFRQRTRFSDEQLILLIKIYLWQYWVEIDPNAELHLSYQDSILWDFELCSDEKHCSPQKCSAYGECYLQRARKKAEQADIIIVNHALLCADLQKEGGLLPEYRYLVVDEAHHFEDAVTSGYGETLKQDHLIVPLKQMVHVLSYLQTEYAVSLRQSSLGDDLNRLIEWAVPRAKQEKSLLQEIDNVFTLVAYFTNQHVEETGYVENLLVDRMILGMEEWLNLGDSASALVDQLTEWLRGVHRIKEGLLAIISDDRLVHTLDELDYEMDWYGKRLSMISRYFFSLADSPTAGPDHEFIRWMTVDQNGEVALHMTPYQPGTCLKTLYADKKSIIFTSATLSTQLNTGDESGEPQKPFTYFRKMLSLDERFEELVLESPFDYESQAYVLIPSDLSSITSPTSFDEILPFFEQLIRTLNGGILALFTSYRVLENLYLALMRPLQNLGVTVLAQRISGGRNKILKAYLNRPESSVLFGTSSFWEGVDIKGDALNTLVIHKLPFDTPSDPVVKARGELFSNAFLNTRCRGRCFDFARVLGDSSALRKIMGLWSFWIIEFTPSNTENYF